jgi:hypothetical protein
VPYLWSLTIHLSMSYREHDKCGNCTKGHRTSDCSTPLARVCVSCKTDDHASWSRECPTFIKKLNDFNDRNPENALQYIPTADPWTWMASSQPAPSQPQTQPSSNRPRTTCKKTQPPRRTQAPRQVDSYIPRYDSYVPKYDRSGKRQQDKDWTQDDQPPQPPPKGPSVHKDLIGLDLLDSRPLTQEYLDSVNNEATSGPTNTTTTTTIPTT